MPTYLVTYDLNKPGADYSDLLKKIKEFPWARLSESSYAVNVNSTPEGLFNTLKPFLDQNDNLYVITLKRPYTGFGPKQVNDWLEQHLPY